ITTLKDYGFNPASKPRRSLVKSGFSGGNLDMDFAMMKLNIQPLSGTCFREQSGRFLTSGRAGTSAEKVWTMKFYPIVIYFSQPSSGVNSDKVITLMRGVLISSESSSKDSHNDWRFVT